MIMIPKMLSTCPLAFSHSSQTPGTQIFVVLMLSQSTYKFSFSSTCFFSIHYEFSNSPSLNSFILYSFILYATDNLLHCLFSIIMLFSLKICFFKLFLSLGPIWATYPKGRIPSTSAFPGALARDWTRNKAAGT